MSIKMKTNLIILVALIAGVSVFSLASAEAADEMVLPESFVESDDAWTSYIWQQAIELGKKLDAKGFPAWTTTWNN